MVLHRERLVLSEVCDSVEELLVSLPIAVTRSMSAPRSGEDRNPASKVRTCLQFRVFIRDAVLSQNLETGLHGLHEVDEDLLSIRLRFVLREAGEMDDL